MMARIVSKAERQASRVGISANILYRLSKHEDPKVRVAVAGNPGTQVFVLERLLRDENEEVRAFTRETVFSLLRNPK